MISQKWTIKFMQMIEILYFIKKHNTTCIIANKNELDDSRSKNVLDEKFQLKEFFFLQIKILTSVAKLIKNTFLNHK